MLLPLGEEGSNEPRDDAKHAVDSKPLLNDDTKSNKFSKATPSLHSAEFARIETSMLFLPFFALGTKNLKSHSGVCINSRKKVNDTYVDFRYKVTSNKEFGHPGQLSRICHHALMAKMQEDQKMAPFRNPINWSWGELQERIGWTSRGGNNNTELKAAIRATLGATITTNLNLIHTANGHKPSKREKSYHLYQSYTFFEDVMPDGHTIADTNYLWLSDWALANMNSFYVAPIDYTLWSLLNQDTVIASRLYEYLIYNFASGNSVFKIGYQKLAASLPVRCERYLSDAQKQLNGALESLEKHHVIDGYQWSMGEENQIILSLFAGQIIGAHRRFLKRDRSDTEIDEAAATLVQEFYRKLNKTTNHDVTPKELMHAKKVISWMGEETAIGRVSHLLSRIRTANYDVKVFGGSMSFWEAEHRDLMKRKKQNVVDEKKASDEKQHDERRMMEKQKKDDLWEKFQRMPIMQQGKVLACVEANTRSDCVLRKLQQRDLDDYLVRSAIVTELQKSKV